MTALQRVDSCFHMPHHCAVTLKAEDPKGFVDTGTELPSIDPHIYLSVSWLHDNAADLDLVPEEKYEEALETIEELERGTVELKAQLAEANEYIDAISVIESSAKFKARRKPGPKKQKTAA